jgi:stage V sporulation protein D (sporulation-specific penicillin-binding protein)
MNQFRPKKNPRGKGKKEKLSGAESDFNFRVNALFFLIFISAAVIIFRMYGLQVASHDYYKALANNQHSVLRNLVPQRGEIYLKEGDELYPVAVNKEAHMAYAVPREISNPIEVAQTVSRVLDLDEKIVREKLSKPDDMYEVLKHRLEEEEIAELKNLKLKGIYLNPESFRYYPAGELASHILGFMGWKENILSGRYGAESYFEEELAGSPGKLFESKDNSGLWVSIKDREMILAKNGDNFVLTIDHVIQYETEKIIKSAIGKFDAEKATAIVMESSTGKILALANYPNFDPNEYGKESMENFRNLAISDSYECGSVFKAFTIASAIDAGKIKPNTTYFDAGEVLEAGYKLKNSDLKSHGLQTMTQVLEKSLNTGVIFAQKQMGNSNFADYMKRFGFGEITGIDLPGEARGNISSFKNLKRNISFYTASYGQGITVTPIQMVAAYNVIANSGTLMKPQVVEKIIRSDGSEEVVAPKEVRKVISAGAATQTGEMLRNVVVNGHGKLADVPGYLVAGKTGTAQVASSSVRGYEEGKHIGSFGGFAPLDNPQFTVFIRIDNPKNVKWAESSAAPAFGELMKFLLDYKNIKPTEEYSQNDLNEFHRTHTLNEFFINIKEKENDEEKEEEDNEK